MISIKRKKNLETIIEELRKFSFSYLDKYAPSKQQLRTYLLKKYFKSPNSFIAKNQLLDLILLYKPNQYQYLKLRIMKQNYYLMMPIRKN